MVARFLALIGTEGRIDTPRVFAIDGVAGQAGLHPVYEAANVRVYADRSRMLRGIGVAVGDLFARDSDQPGKVIDGGKAEAVARSLIVDHWGSYVALWSGPGDQVHVLRDPSGALPCLRKIDRRETLLASDVGLLRAASPALIDLDWEFVRQLIQFPHLRGTRTGIKSIDELLPGSWLTMAGAGATVETCWSPWSFTRRELRITDPNEACERVRATVVSVVGRMLGPFRKPLLELSGGLDSSILAACLATLGLDACCVNLATVEAEGDERRYARLVADRTGLPLLERSADGAARTDPTRPPLSHLVRPGSQAWLHAWEHALVEAAITEDCDAFLSGTGGDNVFCSLSSAAPAADLLRTGAPAAAIRAVGALATIHSASYWQVAGYAIRMAARRPRIASWPRDGSFVPANVAIAEPDAQPWLSAPRGTLPGSRSHARSIFATYAHRGGSERDLIAPTLLPLLAQPVQELCLRIPSWLWIGGGRDRSVARRAFADLLPPEIVERRTKGAVDSFCVRFVEDHLAPFRHILVEGHLAKRGLLDRDALARWFDGPKAPRDLLYFRILTLLDIELWVRDWLGVP